MNKALQRDYSNDKSLNAKSAFFINPALMYSMIWILVLLLYYIRLSELLSPLQASTVILVLGTSMALIIGWLIESFRANYRPALPHFNLSSLSDSIKLPIVSRRLKFAWILFTLGSIIEIIYCEGAPGLGLLGVGREIVYTEYGIPGLHGILNSIFYSCCVIQFTKALLGKTKFKILMIVSFLNPFLGMSRQMFISIAIQYLLIYFCIRTPTIKIYIKSITLILVIIIIFGYIGDLRSGRDHIISLAAPVFEYPDWLPSAIIWAYIYISTPLNNLNYNIEIIPIYLPLETASTFIPSFAREYFLNLVGSKNSWELAHESFNVSSILQSFIADFGIAGSILVMLPLGILFARLMRMANSRIKSFFALIIILHGLVLSFFTNLLFHLVFMFEIIIVSKIVVNAKKK